MANMHLNLPQARKQRGAALVVGLLLLLILTLLAVSSMNSASVEFIMAGNEQYHQNAFQAAETGIAQAMITDNYNPGDTTLPHTIGAAVTGSTTDKYSAQIDRQLNGMPQSALMWTGSLDTFSSYHFVIDSTGTSARNGAAENIQGVVMIAKKDATFIADPNAATKEFK
jgi:type IV pilus assembly protein PilX